MKRIYLSILLALCSTVLMAQEGQTIYNFLKIPTSAHATALGGNNISIIEDDATLALSNPALLSSVSTKTISIGYMNYMSGTGMFTANYTHVLNEKATIGGAAHYLNYGSMKETDFNGNEMGTFSPSDLNLECIFSYTLAKNLVGGIGAKFIFSQIGKYSSTAAAVDLGLNYYEPNLDFSASLAVKNLGGQLSAYNEEYEGLPIDVAIGFTQRIHRTPLRFSLTFDDLTNWNYAFFEHLCLGLDVIIVPQFYVAGGYNFKRPHFMNVRNAGETDGGSTYGAGWSVGCGLTLNKIKAHFAFGKYHMASQSLTFNLAYSL